MSIQRQAIKAPIQKMCDGTRKYKDSTSALTSSGFLNSQVPDSLALSILRTMAEMGENADSKALAS